MNKRDELELVVKEIQPKIIAVTEIIAKNQQTFEVTEYNIPGYELFTNDNPKLGVALYMKNDLNAVRNKVLNKSSFEESVWCNFNSKEGEGVLVGCVYRSPSSGEENFQKLIELLHHEEIGKFNKICIVGDFNMPNINWDGHNVNARDRTFVECLRDSFLENMVKEPTRRRGNNRPTMDDLVLVNDDQMISDIIHCCPLGKSDHDMLFFNMYITADNDESNPMKFDLNRGNYDAMREELKVWDLNALAKMGVEENWETVKNRILEAMERNIPKVETGKKNVKPKWFNGKVKKSVRRKYCLYMRYLRSDAAYDYWRYIEARNTCNRVIKQAKRDYERKISEECKTNPKRFWQYVQSKTKSRSGISPLDKGNGNLAYDSKDKANILNEYFSSVFTRENTTNVPNIEVGSRSDGTFLPDIIVTTEAVKKKLSLLNTCKAQGPDGVPPKVLKELSEELALPLTILFNKSLEEGTVPSEWKRAEVVAIFKKGTRSDPGNYRPVSLTCVLCKMLESFIRDSIINHMDELHLFSDCQHGFRRRRSCVTQLLEVMEHLTNFFDEGEAVDIIYFDFRKAFDSVPHQRLIAKLKSYGITGNIVNWISDFLTGRTQRVRVDNEFSNSAHVLSGIPQGSILGPILFTVFINDISDNIQSLCHIFADDTKIFNTVNNQNVLQADINRLVEWTEVWDLHFNNDKCKVMHLGRNNVNNRYFMTDGNGINKDISTCTQEKDLGVIFDQHLSFETHIQTAINKANKVLGIIKRTFTHMDSDTFLRLYKTMVRPHLEYGNAVWGPHHIGLSQDMERVQRRATRLVPACNGMSYEERLRFLDLFSLKYRRFRGDLIQTFKILNKVDDINPHDFYDFNQGVTRHADHKLYIKRCRLNVRKYSFAFRTAKAWNALTIRTRRARSVDVFKRLLDLDESKTIGIYEFD